MKNLWKRNEPAWHRLMGWGAMLVNARLLLERRERNSLPPENDEYPVMFVPRKQDPKFFTTTSIDNTVEYWSKARVMDTLNDMRQYDQGGTVGWFFVLGAGIAIGWFARGGGAG